MALLDVYAAQAGPPSTPLIQTPSTPGERFGAEFDASLAPDRWFTLSGSRQEGQQKVIDALHTATGQTFANPYGAVSAEEMARLGNQPALIEERKQKLRDARNALQQDVGVGDVIPDPDAVDREIGERGEAVRGRAASLVNTGNGLSAFAGGALAPTPENIAGLLIPPSRLVFGATTVARGFLATLGREAAYQGVTQGALTAGSEALDVLARSETGTAPTLGESVGNIAMGTAAGAVLGGAFHVLHAGPKALLERWNRLPEPVRENAPLEVRDAMKVLETDSIYGEANRLGLPWATHERYQAAAMDPVLRGRAVRLEDLQPADTPMTALATILRGAPGQIQPEGLPRAAARVAALTDADIEPFARQLKPNSFVALDRVNEQMRGLDERSAAIKQEAEQIGMPDVIDLDTAALINDAETNLKRTDLTRRQREAYEHQRDTWLQSVDPHGALKQELERLRTDFFPEHGPALAQIAEERTKLQRQLELARGEAQREVDFLRDKFNAVEAAKPDAPVTRETFGGEPADVAKALEAAEFDRHIRTVRENVPSGMTAPKPVQEPVKIAPDGLAPEQTEAINSAATAVMEGKSGTPSGFKTAKGSTYDLHEDGTTTRNKSLHAGHDPKDVGLKPRSERTLYVDPEFAREIGMWNTSSSGHKRIVVRGDELLMTSRNLASGKQGLDKTINSAKFSTSPTIGSAPVELWKSGAEGFAGNHPGNPITDIAVAKSSLGDFRRVARRELEAVDGELSDARAAAACVAGGGGIP